MTLQDMLGELRGQEKAREAVFWFCFMWYQGPRSDLYRIMVETGYDPAINQYVDTILGPAKKLNPDQDPGILYGRAILKTLYEKSYGPLKEYPFAPIWYADLQEDDIIVSGACHACIADGWPCKVFKHHGAFAVTCVENPDRREPHSLKMTIDGFVYGFKR